MAFKFEIINNALQITDTLSSEVLIYLPARDAWFNENDLDKQKVVIYGVSGHERESREFDLTDCIDNDDVAFTEASFRTWCSLNLGFSNGEQTPTRKQGFMDYNDTTGNVSIVSDTWTTIPNDGLGAFTNKTYKPIGVTEFMDSSVGSITVDELDLGDTIIIRNDFTINPNTNNALLEFRYQLGTGGAAYTLETTLGRLDDGSGKDYRFSLKPDLIYMGDLNTKDNPISLQVKLSTDGVLNNAGTVIQLIKGLI